MTLCQNYFPALRLPVIGGREVLLKGGRWT